MEPPAPAATSYIAIETLHPRSGGGDLIFENATPHRL